MFIGSCTNSRIEDLRAAAAVVKGRKVADNIKEALVVPGSGLVKKRQKRKDWTGYSPRQACNGVNPAVQCAWPTMNADQLGEGEHCASTSNRNFEGRQGFGGRTHLVSPAMAAAATVHGHFVDVRELELN